MEHQLLDNEPPPTENRSENLKQKKLALAAVKRKKFQDGLSTKLLHINLDHCYSSSVDNLSDINNEESKLQAPKDLVEQYFHSHICVDSEKAERSTQLQHCCESRHIEIKFRITTSILKEVSHHKASSCAFVKRKLVPKQLDTKAVWYGKSNEEMAIMTYVTCIIEQ